MVGHLGNTQRTQRLRHSRFAKRWTLMKSVRLKLHGKPSSICRCRTCNETFTHHDNLWPFFPYFSPEVPNDLKLTPQIYRDLSGIFCFFASASLGIQRILLYPLEFSIDNRGVTVSFWKSLMETLKQSFRDIISRLGPCIVTQYFQIWTFLKVYCK